MNKIKEFFVRLSIAAGVSLTVMLGACAIILGILFMMAVLAILPLKIYGL